MLCTPIHSTLFIPVKLTICKTELMNTMGWVNSKPGPVDINRGGYCIWRNLKPGRKQLQEKSNLSQGKAENFFVH